MAVREPLDLLIEALATQDEDIRDNGGTISQDPVNQSSNENDPQSPPISPTTKQRRIRLAKIMSSSSLKKKRIKTSHCKYCNRFKFGRKQVEAHLKENEICASLYKRELKVHGTEGVLTKLYKCLACSSNGAFQLKRHLGGHSKYKCNLCMQSSGSDSCEVKVS